MESTRLTHEITLLQEQLDQMVDHVDTTPASSHGNRTEQTSRRRVNSAQRFRQMITSFRNSDHNSWHQIQWFNNQVLWHVVYSLAVKCREIFWVSHVWSSVSSRTTTSSFLVSTESSCAPCCATSATPSRVLEMNWYFHGGHFTAGGFYLFKYFL